MAAEQHVYIGTRDLLCILREARSWTQHDQALVAASNDFVHQLQGRFRESQVHKELSTSVWLSSALCRPFSVPAGMAQLDSGKSRARALELSARSATGLSPATYRWVAPEGDIGVVAPLPLRQALRGYFGSRLVRVAPWWQPLVGFDFAQAPAGAAELVLFEDQDGVVLLAGAAARLEQVDFVARSGPDGGFPPVALRRKAAAAMEGKQTAHVRLGQAASGSLVSESPLTPCMETVE